MSTAPCARARHPLRPAFLAALAIAAGAGCSSDQLDASYQGGAPGDPTTNIEPVELTDGTGQQAVARCPYGHVLVTASDGLDYCVHQDFCIDRSRAFADFAEPEDQRYYCSSTSKNVWNTSHTEVWGDDLMRCPAVGKLFNPEGTVLGSATAQIDITDNRCRENYFSAGRCESEHPSGDVCVWDEASGLCRSAHVDGAGTPIEVDVFERGGQPVQVGAEDLIPAPDGCITNPFGHGRRNPACDGIAAETGDSCADTGHCSDPETFCHPDTKQCMKKWLWVCNADMSEEVLCKNTEVFIHDGGTYYPDYRHEVWDTNECEYTCDYQYDDQPAGLGNIGLCEY